MPEVRHEPSVCPLPASCVCDCCALPHHQGMCASASTCRRFLLRARHACGVLPHTSLVSARPRVLCSVLHGMQTCACIRGPCMHIRPSPGQAHASQPMHPARHAASPAHATPAHAPPGPNILMHTAHTHLHTACRTHVRARRARTRRRRSTGQRHCERRRRRSPRGRGRRTPATARCTESRRAEGHGSDVSPGRGGGEGGESAGQRRRHRRRLRTSS